MKDNVGIYSVFNGAIENSDNFGDIEQQHRNPVYEVIRIIDCVPLFFEDHYARLKESMRLLGFELQIPAAELMSQITRLVKANQTAFCNVRVAIYPTNQTQDCLVHINKSYYPEEAIIHSGVKVSLLSWERTDPNVKVVNPQYKEAVATRMGERNAFELLLVNSRNQITEGSKSNVFFIKGNSVCTAPGDVVLKGITRKYILEACSAVGLTVEEKMVNAEDLHLMEGAFLSGTSIKVLPIAQIDAIPLLSVSNSWIAAVRRQYDGMIESYVKNHQIKNR